MISLEGEIKISQKELNLDLTLLGGQSFRWKKVITKDAEPEWRGTAFNIYWILKQNNESVLFKAFPSTDYKFKAKNESNEIGKVLSQYFRIDFNLVNHIELWKAAHEHFRSIDTNKAVRVLDQEPLETMISFICSQNNNIKRISAMINWFCEKYGTSIGNIDGCIEYTFPTLEQLTEHQEEMEHKLRNAKFGYRAKFISEAVKEIGRKGGAEWFSTLRKMSFRDARQELVTITGIGYKVADCICLMALNHLNSVPIDTHMFKIAQKMYMPELNKVKTVTPKKYEEISEHFQSVYGVTAGWAQAMLFCSVLPQFQIEKDPKDETIANERNETQINAKKRKK